MNKSICAIEGVSINDMQLIKASFNIANKKDLCEEYYKLSEHKVNEAYIDAEINEIVKRINKGIKDTDELNKELLKQSYESKRI